MPWSALISAGSSLVSGLFGASSAKKARARAIEDEKQKFVRLREAAQLGGFNPLTALQAAGATFGSNLPSGAPPLASIEMVTNAITEFGNIATGETARKRAREDLEFDLAKLKLEQAQHSAARAVAPRLPKMGKSGASMSTTSVTSPYGKFTVNQEDSRQSIMAGGVRINPHLGYDDAEAYEKRYGDVAAAIYGLGVGAADGYKTFIEPRYQAGKAKREAEEKARNPLGLPPFVPGGFGIPLPYQYKPAPTIGTFNRGAFTGFPVLRP